MKIEFDKNVFNEWFNLNGFSRNGVIKALGTRDPNKVGRWLLGQVISTDDLIGLCNHYNLEIGDFLIITDDDEDSTRINTILPDTIKDRRLRKTGLLAVSKDSNNETSSSPITDTLTDKDIAITRLSLGYERKINDLIAAHSLEIKESIANTRQQMESRNKIISTLQNTIDTLNDNIKLHNKEVEKLQDTIATLQLTIQQQQNIIASYDSIIRKQKKIPSSTSPFFSGQPTMVQDGGGAISAAHLPNNDE